MEERTQIKFRNPDIDGTSIPSVVEIEKEEPIEGTVDKEDGNSFVYHKWLCTGDQYFMASDSLDAMLKAIPYKVGKPTKIEKVVNPKGGFPFFLVNGMNKDQIANQVIQTPIEDSIATSIPPQATNVPASGGSSSSIDQKLDRIILMLQDLKASSDNKNALEGELPF